MNKTIKHVDGISGRLARGSDALGNLMVDAFHYLALFAIGLTIVWAAAHAFFEMAAAGSATIEDILLLFIYLELGAMVGIYFKTKRMPARFLIYIAITALTRMMIGHIQAHHTPDIGILYISGAILLLAIATLIVRYGSNKFPNNSLTDDPQTRTESMADAD